MRLARQLVTDALKLSCLLDLCAPISPPACRFYAATTICRVVCAYSVCIFRNLSYLLLDCNLRLVLRRLYFACRTRRSTQPCYASHATPISRTRANIAQFRVSSNFMRFFQHLFYTDKAHEKGFRRALLSRKSHHSRVRALNSGINNRLT